MSKYLVTGAAGFIGHHLCHRLLSEGHEVVGLDNLNRYYEVELKDNRLGELLPDSLFKFIEESIENSDGMGKIFEEHNFDVVVHLAAQAGVRYSIDEPMAYIQSNLVGFANILEGVRNQKIGHLVYASSSSVYGANTTMPFSESHNVDHPISLYAATKKSNELMAHSYSALYNMPITGLRFFTVYGPWGRPDMALFKFTKAILNGDPIDVYNNGDMARDFTYVADIVEGVVKVMDIIPEGDPNWSGDNPDPGSSFAPYKIYNIGNNKPVKLLRMIEVLEKALGKKAIKNMMPMQPGDVKETAANIDALQTLAGFEPKMSIEEGIPKFVEWYRRYYKV